MHRVNRYSLGKLSLAATQMDPSSTLQLSRQAPKLLSSSLPRARKFPFTLLDRAEGPATWIEYEALFQACLRAGDDKSAHHCLELLSNRFGSSDKRVIGLRGMYEEAIATNTAGLEKVLQSYEKVLAADPMNVVRPFQPFDVFQNLTPYP